MNDDFMTTEHVDNEGRLVSVVGLDVSYSSTGVARLGAPPRTIKPKNKKGLPRLDELEIAIRAATDGATLVVLEDYAFSRANQAHAKGELGGIVRLGLWRRQIPTLLVAPSTLKVFATGVGNCEKVDVIVAARDRLGYDGTQNDEADALWLMHLGLHHLGMSHLSVTVPKSHLRALDAPEMMA